MRNVSARELTVFTCDECQQEFESDCKRKQHKISDHMERKTFEC